MEIEADDYLLNTAFTILKLSSALQFKKSTPPKD